MADETVWSVHIDHPGCIDIISEKKIMVDQVLSPASSNASSINDFEGHAIREQREAREAAEQGLQDGPHRMTPDLMIWPWRVMRVIPSLYPTMMRPMLMSRMVRIWSHVNSDFIIACGTTIKLGNISLLVTSDI